MTSPAGVKGLFVGEIVQALQEGRLDLAVHSAKDLPSEDPEGIVVSAVPERADPFDVLVTRRGRAGGSDGGHVEPAPPGSALEGAAGRVVDLRGNVDTRLRARGGGGRRAGPRGGGAGPAGDRATGRFPFPLEDMVPAPGQGALAVQVRTEDDTTLQVLGRIDHEPSHRALRGGARRHGPAGRGLRPPARRVCRSSGRGYPAHCGGDPPGRERPGVGPSRGRHPRGCCPRGGRTRFAPAEPMPSWPRCEERSGHPDPAGRAVLVTRPEVQCGPWSRLLARGERPGAGPGHQHRTRPGRSEITRQWAIWPRGGSPGPCSPAAPASPRWAGDGRPWPWIRSQRSEARSPRWGREPPRRCAGEGSNPTWSRTPTRPRRWPRAFPAGVRPGAAGPGGHRPGRTGGGAGGEGVDPDTGRCLSNALVDALPPDADRAFAEGPPRRDHVHVRVDGPRVRHGRPRSALVAAHSRAVVCIGPVTAGCGATAGLPVHGRGPSPYNRGAGRRGGGGPAAAGRPSRPSRGAERERFPESRPRRMRRTAALRSLVRETDLAPENLIAPLFVKEGIDQPHPIPSMPGQFQHTLESLRKEARDIADRGVPGFVLFGIPARKDAEGRRPGTRDGIAQRGLRELRDELGDAQCPDRRPVPRRVHRPRPLRGAGRGRVGRQRPDTGAVSRNRRGPGRGRSGPGRALGHDGRPGRARSETRSTRRVRRHRHPGVRGQVRLRASTGRSARRPSARRSSATAPATRWIRPTRDEALREIRADIEEGADIVMVKPALPYLDVIRRAKQDTGLPAGRLQRERGVRDGQGGGGERLDGRAAGRPGDPDGHPASRRRPAS